jgi:macrolide-specific efflux system membrane fusion protein
MIFSSLGSMLSGLTTYRTGAPMTTSVETTDTAPNWVGDFEFEQSAAGEVPRGRRWLRWAIVLVVVMALGVGAVWIINPFAATAATLVTAKATIGTVVSSVGISGSVASSTIDELSFGAAGAVTAVKVAVGDKVAAGQILATIDDSALQVQIENAQANLTAAQARLATDVGGPTAATTAASIAQAKAAVTAAKATLAADTLANAGATILAEDTAAVTSAKSALSATELRAAAQIASDKAALASANLALTTLKQTGPDITAPIAGTVTAVNLKVGQVISGSTGSSSSSSSTTGQIEVMDLAHLQIAGEASETDIPKLKMGQAATVTATSLGTETAVGTVCALSVVGTQISGVTSFGVTVCLDGSDPALLVGMSATAAVVTDRADGAILVPSLAVKTVGGQQVVTVLGADGKTQTNVPVTVGITNGSQTQILTGLSGTETVVETLQTNATNRAGGAGGGTRIFTPGGFGGG